jgi:hypothetical protein
MIRSRSMAVIRAFGVSALLAGCMSPTRPRSAEPLWVFTDHLRSGFDLGIESSFGRRRWADVEDGVLVMRYPRGEFWGTTFIVAGIVASPPYTSVDVSSRRSLRFEMRGVRARSAVRVALADRGDPEGHADPGAWRPIGTAWRGCRIDLDSVHVDLTRLYVVTAFRFTGETGDTVYCRNVRFEP